MSPHQEKQRIFDEYARTREFEDWNDLKNCCIEFDIDLDELNGGLGEQETGQIFEYAKFLKQPLTLGMFVPVDDQGNVLKEPKDEEFNWAFLEQKKIYDKAKEKVLFESVELKSDTEESWMFKINGKYPFIIRKTMRIESLLIYNTEIELTH